MGRTENPNLKNDYERAFGWYGHFNKSEMALFSECTDRYAQKTLDTADIVREAILRQLRHRSVVRGSRELPFWLASSQRYTADQDPQHQICFGNNKLRVEGEGHLSAPVESSEHPSPLSGFLKLSQPI